MQHGVFEVPEDMQGTVLYRAMFPLTHEATQELTQPYHTIYDMVRVVRLWPQLESPVIQPSGGIPQACVDGDLRVSVPLQHR